MKDGDQLQ